MKHGATTALVAFLATALSSRFVAAEAPNGGAIDLALAPQGLIGAWLLSGPFENSAGLSLDQKPGQGTVDGRAWRSLVHPSGLVDFGGDVTLPPGKTQSALLGTWLRLETTFDGWLLVAADGAFRVAVDGRLHYQRQVAHRRGRGLDPIPLRLSPGLHRILFVLERRDNRSTFSAILRERDGFRVPSSVSVVLQGRGSGTSLLSRLIDFKLNLDTRELPLSLTVELSAPAGAPRMRVPVGIDLLASVGGTNTHWEVGTWDLTGDAPLPFTVRLGPVDRFNLGEQTELTVHVGGASFKRQFSLSQPIQDTLTTAITAAQNHALTDSTEPPFDALRASLEYHLASTVDAIFKGDRSNLAQTSTQLAFWAKSIASGSSPFKGPGWVQAALRSPYDGQPQSVFVHVPPLPNPPSPQKRPLVLALHGYNGNPRKILEAFLDDPGPHASVPGFVLAPEAHGNAFYRGAGERAVYDALDWAAATYPIDPTKVTITGVSMGGTGAADIAFRQSERFAAAAPLCGYQSFFVRNDTARKPLRPWERSLMHLFSPASWAESGQDVPLYVAHGTLDRPLENSKVLTNRYRELGYRLEQDWPELGHAVWKKTYHHAGLFSWLAKWQKDADPPYVSLTTGQLRLGRKFWLQITEFETALELAHADARTAADNRITLHTRAVSGLCLHETARLNGSQPLYVAIDDQSLEVPVGTTRCFVKSKGTWSIATQPKPSLQKQPYVEGPWTDLLAEPLVVVYGTRNPRTAELNRFVAARLFEPQYGVTLHIPVVSDQEYASRSFAYRRAVYVGRPDDHLQFSAIADKLPIRVLPQRIEVGSSHYDEPDVGAAFVYFDPDRPDRLLGFVTGNGPEGLLRVLALPLLVPDFVVFDQGLDAAAGEPILGPSAFVRAAGFFQADWSLPSKFDDSRVSVPSR